MSDGGRQSTRLYAFLRKADIQRDLDRLLKAIEDEVDSSSGQAQVEGFSYNCDSSVQVRDVVYIAGANLVNRASGGDMANLRERPRWGTGPLPLLV